MPRSLHQRYGISHQRGTAGGGHVALRTVDRGSSVAHTLILLSRSVGLFVTERASFCETTRCCKSIPGLILLMKNDRCIWKAMLSASKSGNEVAHGQQSGLSASATSNVQDARLESCRLQATVVVFTPMLDRDWHESPSHHTQVRVAPLVFFRGSANRDTCTEQQPRLPLRQAVLGRPLPLETSAPSRKCLLPARRCRGPRVHPLHLPPKRPRRPTVARSRHRCIGTVGQRSSVTSSSFAVTNTPPACRPSKQQAAWDMDKDVFTQARFVACTVSLLRLARSGQSEASINFELDYHDSRVTNFSARVRA